MRVRPARGAVGPFTLELDARFGAARVTRTGLALPDPDVLLGLSFGLRRAVKVGGGHGVAAWQPGVGLEVGVLDDGQLRNVAADDRSVLTVLSSAVGTDGPEPMVPVILTDGTLQMVDASLTTRGDTGVVPLPPTLEGVAITGPFPFGACDLPPGAPFYVEVKQGDAHFGAGRYGGLFAPPAGAVVGSFCAEIEDVGNTRFLEVEAEGGRFFQLPGGEAQIATTSFRTASAERRSGDAEELIFAHLVPPQNALRIDVMEPVQDGAGLRFVPAGEGAETPGFVFQALAGSFTSPDVVAASGAEEVVFLLGEVQLFPNFELGEGAKLGFLHGPLGEGGVAATVDLPECSFVITCHMEVGDVDGDGADEILIARSDLGAGPASALLIDLSP
jgi:hypothetical protein